MTTKEIKASELKKGDYFIFNHTRDVKEIIAITKHSNSKLDKNVKVTFSDGSFYNLANFEYVLIIDTEIEHGFDFDDIVGFAMTLDSQLLNVIIGYYENNILDKFCSFSDNEIMDEDEKGYPKYIGLLYYIVSKFDILLLRAGQKEFIKTLIRYYNDSTTTLKQQLDLELPKFALKIVKIEQELNG